jgi:chromosome segregation ATPase
VGWQSNVFGLLRGHVLQDRVAQLEAEQKSLVAEIDARQKRVQSLELEIDRYHAQNLLDVEQRRAQAEQELNSEREALKRLEERLRKLEQNTPPPQDKPPQQ